MRRDTYVCVIDLHENIYGGAHNYTTTRPPPPPPTHIRTHIHKHTRTHAHTSNCIRTNAHPHTCTHTRPHTKHTYTGTRTHNHKHKRKHKHTHPHPHPHPHTHARDEEHSVHLSHDSMQLVGSLKTQVFFAKEPYKRDDIPQRALQKRRYSAKETYNFQEPTNRSPPIACTCC